MPFVNSAELRYYSFDSLADQPVKQAIFTRQGGVSPQPWAALNVGGTVGDDAQRVLENRQRTFHALGLELDSLYDVWQVHGTQVVCADAPRPAHQAHLHADAILTDRPGVTLFMRFADCVPVYLYDPQRKVIGLAHAGWKGTVQRTAAEAVAVMRSRYGSRAEDILAAIGPSIGAHHYEVGEEVSSLVRQSFGTAASALLQPASGNQGGETFDLWAANRLVLQDAGVRQVEVAGICTACHLEDWYSHRAEAGKTGRFGAIFCLNGSK